MGKLLDQSRLPLVEVLNEYSRGGIYPFHTPGHKGGRFAPPEIEAAIGKSGLALDLPAMTATDNTMHPTGCVRDAQALAAELYGAGETFFLTAGSTLGIAAAVLATVFDGQTIVLPRNVHRSVAAALVLSGARPRFVWHDVLPSCGALGVAAQELDRALSEEPKPKAVLLTRPTYYGLTSELGPLVEICRAHRTPLIVDEAHGGHLHFLPAGHPKPALAAGADLVVQSCHKTLGSLVGTAQLHVGRGSLVDHIQVRGKLNLLQTTSPNYLLLASLDAARHHMCKAGPKLFACAVEEAEELEKQINRLPGLEVLQPQSDERLAGHGRDPLRLVVNVAGTGWNGFDVETHLRNHWQVEDEMADWYNIVLILSPQDDPLARERLLQGLQAVSESPRKTKSNFTSAELMQPPIPPLVQTPRQAALGPHQPLPLTEAIGHVCAEMVMFYPPGIPLLMPGELVTEETVDACRKLLVGGAHCYASDVTLKTLRVSGSDRVKSKCASNSP